MDTRFQVPASWSAVRAAAAVATADGEVGAESASEHPTERDAMMVKADK
jgi:tellurite resistance protein